MNREIKFRGKTVDTKQWVYGYPYIGIPETYTSFIIPEWVYNGYINFEEKSKDTELSFEKFYEVEHKTISQFTGIKDKNGIEIYKGDIVKVKGMKRVGEYITEIIWEGFGFKFKENKTYLNDHKLLSGMIEVIGNIYETPELLSK